MSNYILPGSGQQLETNDTRPYQASPLLRYYSPRLFGAPPQLTNQCDMRILSSDGENPGPVGDFYLNQILQDANIANFVVGRARFTGGMSSWFNILRELHYYGHAMKKYDIYDTSGNPTGTKNIGASLEGSIDLDTYQKAYKDRDDEPMDTGSAAEELAEKMNGGASGWEGVANTFANARAQARNDTIDLFSANSENTDIGDDDKDYSILNISSIIQNNALLDNLGSWASGGAGLVAALKTSLSVQQPFYTFEDDWNTYINNVKMMINSAVIMLGLQKACVRIGDNYYPIGMDVNVKAENDVWSNYRFITPTSDLGAVTAKNTDNGETSQYVSFMIDPSAVSESMSNSIGQSQIYSSVLNAGGSIGSEIAFISNSTGGSTTDKTINLAKESKQAANKVLKSLSSGNGRFTAAIASSMARSFTGDHTIYPEIFQSHTSTSSMSVTIHLSSDAGDPYSYLCNILVPLFFILGMTLPMLSQNNASAYSYPPIIQCNIPGMWGTRLGMVREVTINKNPNGKDVSVNGYPLQIDVTMSIADLQHVLLTSPMNKISVFLNNHTMFDYIAQMTGVDKYRVNGSMRTITRLALAASALNNTFNNISDALMTDWHSLTNKIYGYDRQ